MSLLSDNVIPGNLGRVFGTNAKKIRDLEKIKEKVLELKGVNKVESNSEVFPMQIVVYTSKLVPVAAVEEQVILAGFHAIPKETFDI